MLVDPWPEGWAEDWCATGDVYVGYNNGYYLYNRSNSGRRDRDQYRTLARFANETVYAGDPDPAIGLTK